MALPLSSRLLYQLYHRGQDEGQASSLFKFMLEILPPSLLDNLRPFISELFALHHHRGTLATFIGPLVNRLLLTEVRVPEEFPCQLATSITHLTPQAAFIMKNITRSSPALAALAECLDKFLVEAKSKQHEKELRIEDTIGEDEEEEEEEEEDGSNKNNKNKKGKKNKKNKKDNDDFPNELEALWKVLEVISVIFHCDDLKKSKRRGGFASKSTADAAGGGNDDGNDDVDGNDVDAEGTGGGAKKGRKKAAASSGAGGSSSAAVITMDLSPLHNCLMTIASRNRPYDTMDSLADEYVDLPHPTYLHHLCLCLQGNFHRCRDVINKPILCNT